MIALRIQASLPGATDASPRDAIARRTWAMLATLTLLMLLNHLDRQVVVSMFPYLQHDWGLSNVELASLVSVVSLTVGIGAVPLSFAADRWGHVTSIFVMALVWSAATMGCALAASYTSLFWTRMLIGAGEAAYGTVGAALLSTLFPSRVRGRVLAIFMAGSAVGQVTGIGLGGALVSAWGWQAAFLAAGLPGFLLALLFLVSARHFPRELQASVSRPRARLTVSGAMTAIWRTRGLLRVSLGGALQLVCIAAVMAWLPSYFNGVYGLAPSQAGFFAACVILVGVVGMMLWSATADAMCARVAQSRFILAAIASGTTAVVLFVAFVVLRPGRAQVAAIVIGAASMMAAVSLAPTIVSEIAAPGIRATALSVLVIVQNVLGLAAGPLLAGVVADRYGLATALGVTALAGIPAALLFVNAATPYAKAHEGAGGPQEPPLRRDAS